MRRAVPQVAFFLVLLAGASHTLAGDTIASQLINAARDSATDRFRKVAAAIHQDEWLVLDELVARGHPDVAVRVVRLRPSPDEDAQRRYLSSVDVEDTRSARETLRKAQSNARKREFERVLQTVGDDRLDGIVTVSTVQAGLLSAICLKRLGRADEALTAYLSTGELARSLGWTKLELVARSGAARLAQSLERHGQWTASLARMVELAGHRQDLRRAAVARVNLAGARELEGDFASGLQLLERAYVDATNAADVATATTAASNAARLCARVGSPAKARTWLDRARTTNAKIDDALERLRILGLEAAVFSDLGQHGRALAAIEAALGQPTLTPEIRHDLTLQHAAALASAGRVQDALRAILPLSDRSTPAVRREHARLLRLAGKLGDARSVLAARPEIDPIEQGQWHLEMGRVSLQEQSLDRAIDELTMASGAFNEVGAHDFLAQTQLELAHAARRQGRFRAGLRIASEGIQSLDRAMLNLSDLVASEARAHYASLFRVAWKCALSLGHPDAAVDLAEAWRAQSLLRATRGLRRPLGAADAQALRGRSARLSRSRRAYSQARAAGNRKATRAARAALQESESAYLELLERLDRTNRQGANAVADTPRPLAPDEALVYLVEDDTDASALIRTSQRTSFVRVGAVQDFRRKISDVQQALANRDDTWERHRDRLAALMKPVLSEVSHAHTLHLCTEGPASFIPWTLIVPDQTSVRMVPSWQSVTEIELRPRNSDKSIFVGDPEYSPTIARETVRAAIKGTRLRQLPGSRAEVTGLAAPKDTVLLGARASESLFLKALHAHPSWHAVHFACHGIVDPEAPALSGLALTPEVGHDGLFSVAEISRHRIRAEVVVLSACDTALGASLSGEGVFGLPRSFLAAGAKRVLASLWKVPDDATKNLMWAVYKYWRKGHSLDEALGSAQVEVSREKRWAHPYYWGAWVLWGVR